MSERHTWCSRLPDRVPDVWLRSFPGKRNFDLRLDEVVYCLFGANHHLIQWFGKGWRGTVLFERG